MVSFILILWMRVGGGEENVRALVVFGVNAGTIR
jgi:hypothetical protein